MARCYPTAHQRAKLVNIIRNLVSELILFEHIKVIKSRKLPVQRLFNKIITLAKKETLHGYRQICQIIRKQVQDQQNTPILTKIKQLAKRYQNQTHGNYLQIHNLGNRQGDNATIYRLSLL